MSYDARGEPPGRKSRIAADHWPPSRIRERKTILDNGDYYSTFGLLGNGSHTRTYSYDTANSPATSNRDVMTGEASVLSGGGYSSFVTRYKNVWTHGFGYDTAYNPTRFDYFDHSSGTDLTYSGLGFTSDNQHSTGDFGASFGFDGNGNPTTYKNAGFSFDPEDRLTAITSPAFSASYDGDGLRATKTVGGTTTYFIYDGSTPVVEETWNGSTATVTATNGYAADGWRARYEGTVAYDYLYDPQGNLVQRQTRTAYNQGLGAFDQTIYEAYGALRSDTLVTINTAGGAATSPRDPVGFGGQYGYYTDKETGLLCLTHRYYDPGTGRFVNRDPIGYQGGLNLYAFCSGNPVNWSDPSGHAVGDWIDENLLGGSISNWGTVQGDYEGGRATLAQRNGAAAMGVTQTVVLAGTVISGGFVVKAAVKVGVGLVAKRVAVAATVGIAGSIRNVNPGYGAPGTVENCVNCADATEQTLNGNWVSAVRSGAQPISVLTQKYGGRFKGAINAQDIETQLLKAGPGSRGIVYLWNKLSVPGHVFNAVNQNGVIRFLDGQTGTEGSFRGFKNFSFLRTR